MSYKHRNALLQYKRHLFVSYTESCMVGEDSLQGHYVRFNNNGNWKNRVKKTWYVYSCEINPTYIAHSDVIIYNKVYIFFSLAFVSV